MNKYQKLASNTAIFAIGSFGAKLLSFFLVRLYTSFMTPEIYSTADLLYQANNVLYPIITLCMADAIIRYGIDKAYDDRQIYTTAMTSTIAGMTLLALFIPIFNLTAAYSGYAFILYVYCYCSGFRQLASNFVRAKGYVKLFVADGIFATFTTIIFNIIFLVVFRLGANGYILSMICSDVLSFLTLTVVAGLNKYFSFKFINKSLFKEMLKYSLPLIPSYILWWITAASDRFFIIAMVGSKDNGIYSSSSKIPTLLLFVTTLFYQAWQMSAIENKDDKELGSFYTKVINVYSSLIFIAAAGLIMIIKPLTMILVDKEYYFGYHYAPLLVTAMVFQCLCQFLSSVYNVRKKSVNSMLTSLVAAVINIILNFVLIPKYGVYGAAIATAASYFACFAVRIFDARCYIPFRYNFIKAIINTIVVVYMAAVAILEPKLKYLQLIVLFVVIVIFNFEAIAALLKQFFARRKKAEKA